MIRRAIKGARMAIGGDDPQFCLFGIDHWATCMSKGEWANWVSAIGTSAAFFTAIGLVLYQVYQSRRLVMEQSEQTYIQGLARLLRIAEPLYRYGQNVQVILDNQDPSRPQRPLQDIDPLKQALMQLREKAYDMHVQGQAHGCFVWHAECAEKLLSEMEYMEQTNFAGWTNTDVMSRRTQAKMGAELTVQSYMAAGRYINQLADDFQRKFGRPPL